MPTASSAKRPLQPLRMNRVPHLRDGLFVFKLAWGAILIALPLPSCLKAQPLTLSSGASLTLTSTRSTTILHLFGQRILLKRDNTVAPSSQPTLKLIAELPGKALLLTDTYPSRPTGLSRCQAGEERFLRLIALSPTPKETGFIKVASCRDNIELADDGLAWSVGAESPFPLGVLTIHWLKSPSDPTQPRTLALHIGSDGWVIKPVH